MEGQIGPGRGFDPESDQSRMFGGHRAGEASVEVGNGAAHEGAELLDRNDSPGGAAA